MSGVPAGVAPGHVGAPTPSSVVSSAPQVSPVYRPSAAMSIAVLQVSFGTAPGTHISSIIPSPSSSHPLPQSSAAAMQADRVHIPSQAFIPVEPQAVMHGAGVAPSGQSNPSS